MSRRNRRDSEGSEFVLECKAAFLAIFDDIEDKIESKKRLNVVLQQSGRNPNRTALNKYWPEDTTEMYFDDFVEICRKEPVTSADDLMKAFRKIDLNGDGYISLDELYKIMNAQGESMSRDEVRKMIDEVDENKDGRLDYSEFTNMIMKTTEDSKKISKKIMEKKERKKKRAAERLRNAELSAANAASTTTDTAKKQVDSDSNVDELATDVKTEKENLGSMTSLKSSTKVKDDVKGSRSSVRTAAKEQESLSSSRVSIRSQAREEKVNLGSKVSLRSEKARSQRSRADDADVEMGSKVSLQTQNDNENMGSRLSVRSKEIKEKGSNASLWSQMDPSAEGKSVDPVDTASQALGSKASLSWIKEKGSSNEGAESSSRRRDSQLSQKLSPRDEKRDSDIGSQTSLRSEDVPRPSPRVMRRGGEESSKGKSPSIRSMRKLPDVRTLEDWTHYTSKGCFFYEEEEIVSHVYRLKMTTDSQVYITAYPVEEPQCLKLPSTEPIDTAIFIFDDQGKLIHCSEQRDTKGTYGIKCELSAGEYQVVPYTTGCRFKQRSADQQGSMKEAKLVKKLDDKVVITSKFRTALEDIFDLCDLDDNGTMSKDEFNWFNLRTSGEELGEDEWDVVEERTELKEGEITKAGFIALNEMEAEDAAGDTDDLWITLSSMGLNKALIMDEACPYRIDVYIEEQSRKRPVFKVTGIESLDKKEYVSEICNYVIDKAGDPVRIKNMKDLYLYTYKTEFKATVVVDNRSRSMVNLEVDCSRSRNVVSNREALDHTLDIDPQETAIAHHLMPKSELQDWSISCTETIHK